MKKNILGFIIFVFAFFISSDRVLADNLSVNFESPTYVTGSIGGQDGWGNSINPTYDQGVVTNGYGYASFGSQSFRISNAVTSGSFGDWVFSKSLVNEVGETVSTNNGQSGGVRQQYFEAQFDLASASPSGEQPGLQVSVSPDRGDGSRMSFLRFLDTSSGIDVVFADVQGTGSPANFVSTTIASGLDRTIPHTIKITMNVVDGPSNDIVKVYVDGVLVHTGTSWENYYLFDSEASAEQTPRTIDSLIFQARAGGGTAPGTLGYGFLFDNFSLSSGPVPPVLVGPPTLFSECSGVSWKIFNNPTFSKKSQCEKYVRDHQKTIKGQNVRYTAYGLKREVDMKMTTGENAGYFEYDDLAKGWYNVKVSSVKVEGNIGWFAGKVMKASNPSWVGLWLFAKVEDGTPDKIWGSFTDETTALSGVATMTTPSDGPFEITKKDIKIY